MGLILMIDQPVLSSPWLITRWLLKVIIIFSSLYLVFLFFSDGNGTDFLAEEEENLINFVESQRFLSLFQFSYESEAYARR